MQLSSGPWLIAFRACLEPLVAEFGQGWRLTIRGDQGTVAIHHEKRKATFVVALPDGCETISPIWVAQRVADQLRVLAARPARPPQG